MIVDIFYRTYSITSQHSLNQIKLNKFTEIQMPFLNWSSFVELSLIGLIEWSWLGLLINALVIHSDVINSNSIQTWFQFVWIFINLPNFALGFPAISVNSNQSINHSLNQQTEDIQFDCWNELKIDLINELLKLRPEMEKARNEIISEWLMKKEWMYSGMAWMTSG